MRAYDIHHRYQELLSEKSRLLDSIQAGFLLDSEAAIAIADLRGRMNCLHKITSNQKTDGDGLPFAQVFSMEF